MSSGGCERLGSSALSPRPESWLGLRSPMFGRGVLVAAMGAGCVEDVLGRGSVCASDSADNREAGPASEKSE